MIPQVSHGARQAAGAFALVLGAIVALPVQAQLFGGDDEARQAILRLRQEVADVRAEDQRARLQLASQIQELQRQISTMRGQIETLTKQVADAQQTQRDMYLDMAERQPGAGDAGSLLAASDDEQSAYDSAIDSFRQGSYSDAAQALGAFVQQYPQSGFAPTAQFYLGSSLYALKDYNNAIARLQTMVQNWPDNQRAPDALLVIAGSQIELNDRASARATLQRIVQQYAGSQAANTARDRLQLLQ